MFCITQNKIKGTPMNPVRQVAEKRQYNWHLLRMENVMNYSLSIWEEKETKRYPSIFWFIVCVLIFAVQNITSIRRRPKLLFLGVGLPLLKRRSKWKTHFKALTAVYFLFLFQMWARINTVVKNSYWYAHWTRWFFCAFLLFFIHFLCV